MVRAACLESHRSRVQNSLWYSSHMYTCTINGGDPERSPPLIVHVYMYTAGVVYTHQCDTEGPVIQVSKKQDVSAMLTKNNSISRRNLSP